MEATMTNEDEDRAGRRSRFTHPISEAEAATLSRTHQHAEYLSRRRRETHKSPETIVEAEEPKRSKNRGYHSRLRITGEQERYPGVIEDEEVGA